MSKDKWYLKTIACNIDLSSCRLIAESLARALNTKLCSRRRLNGSPTELNISDSYLTFAYKPKSIMSADCMASIVNQSSRTQLESYEGNVDKPIVVKHGWINKMAVDDSDELFNTPPCSSPPSPTDDSEEIIVNPPVLNMEPFPFHTRFFHTVKSENVFSNGAKLREKLQQYADVLLSSVDDNTDEFYDTDADSCESDNKSNSNQQPCQNEVIENSSENDCNKVGIETEEQKCSSSSEQCIRDCLESILNLDVSDHSESCVSIDVHPASPNEQSIDTSIFNVSDENQQGETASKLDNRLLRKVKETEVEERPKLLRTTSLKTGKTPPGTPGRKKIVRFADVLGLDLEAVRHIISDDLPHVPSSAFNDLKLPPENPPFSTTSIHSKQQSLSVIKNTWNPVPSESSPLTGLLPLFDAPGLRPDFLDRVRAEWVSLEKITVADMSVHCICCVLNVFFEKKVTARYTTNDWQTYNEVVASYLPHSSDGKFDRFAFSLFLQPSQKKFSQRLCFALQYQTKGVEKWDNNRGQNYVLRFNDADDNATSLFLPTLESDGSSWIHFY